MDELMTYLKKAGTDKLMIMLSRPGSPCIDNRAFILDARNAKFNMPMTIISQYDAWNYLYAVENNTPVASETETLFERCEFYRGKILQMGRALETWRYDTLTDGVLIGSEQYTERTEILGEIIGIMPLIDGELKPYGVMLDQIDKMLFDRVSKGWHMPNVGWTKPAK